MRDSSSGQIYALLTKRQLTKVKLLQKSTRDVIQATTKYFFTSLMKTSSLIESSLSYLTSDSRDCFVDFTPVSPFNKIQNSQLMKQLLGKPGFCTYIKSVLTPRVRISTYLTRTYSLYDFDEIMDLYIHEQQLGQKVTTMSLKNHIVFLHINYLRTHFHHMMYSFI